MRWKYPRKVIFKSLFSKLAIYICCSRCQNFDEGSQNLAENCNDNILNWTLPAPRDTIATLETAMQRSSVSEINFKPVLLHPSHPEEPMVPWSTNKAQLAF